MSEPLTSEVLDHLRRKAAPGFNLIGIKSSDLSALLDEAAAARDSTPAPTEALDRVREVLREIEDPNPEGDWDWHNDPVGCIADALRTALGEHA